MTDSERDAIEVPVQIFDEFLKELRKEPQLHEVVDRLRKVLLESKDWNEASIRSAMLSDTSDS